MTRLSPKAEELLRITRRADGATAADRARVQRRLAPVFAAGTTAAATLTSASAGAKALLGLGGAKVGLAQVALWVAVGAGTGALVTVSAYTVSTHVALRAPSQQPASKAPARAVPSKSPTQTAASEPRAPVATHSALDSRAQTVGVEPVAPVRGSADPKAAVESSALPRPPESGSATGVSALAAETGLLQAAQRSLQSGRPAETLRLLDEHAARFADGVLVAEQRATRVLALCELGQVQEARRQAQALAHEAPDSPVLPRVMRSCAFGR